MSMLPLWPEESNTFSEQTRRCAQCGNALKPAQRKYCGEDCQHEAQRRYLICLQCGEQYRPVHSRQKYCSQRCALNADVFWQRKREAAAARGENLPLTRPLAVCIVCGKPLSSLQKRQGNKRYCSYDCMRTDPECRVAMREGHKRRREMLALLPKAPIPPKSKKERPPRPPMTAEQRQAISAALKGRKLPPDRRAKSRAQWEGLTLEERREKNAAARANAVIAVRSPQHRAKLQVIAKRRSAEAAERNRRTCVACGREFIQKDHRSKGYCSRLCWLTTYYASDPKHMVSSIEVTVGHVLDDLGITYDAQKSIGMYAADFYLMDTNTVLEVNGCYWHGCDACGFNNPDAKKHDRVRRAAIRRAGFDMAVVWEHDVRKDAMAAVKRALGWPG